MNFFPFTSKSALDFLYKCKNIIKAIYIYGKMHKVLIAQNS